MTWRTNLNPPGFSFDAAGPMNPVMYWRAVAKVWVLLVVAGAVLWFLYALPRGLCDTGTCPSGHWLTPVLIGLAVAGLVATVFLVYFLPRWNEREQEPNREAGDE